MNLGHIYSGQRWSKYIQKVSGSIYFLPEREFVSSFSTYILLQDLPIGDPPGNHPIAILCGKSHSLEGQSSPVVVPFWSNMWWPNPALGEG